MISEAEGDLNRVSRQWSNVTKTETITIARRFRGPANSGNGGYVCGRVAAYLDGVARVRLRVPPPLDTPLTVRSEPDGVKVLDDRQQLIAQGWPASIDLDVPPSPSLRAAEMASSRYVGFSSHRFSTCFVCGTDRQPGDALRIYAGPVAEPPVPGMVACTWTPGAALATDHVHVDRLYVWCVLDCPGGFSFPHPDRGTILLGELTVGISRTPIVGEAHVVAGWEIRRDGRKHFTGTAIYDVRGRVLATGNAVWFEVPDV